MNQDIAIEINSASKIYKNNFTALNNISFNIHVGDFFALLGPNGAGKTTLISALAGLLKLSNGAISVMGFCSSHNPLSVKRILGLVPQELVFDPFFNVYETLTIQSGYYGIKNNTLWINELIEGLNLGDKKYANMRQLSGGMKRRVMVAQALVHKPQVIVLDEPTAGVDIELRQNLWNFIKDLNQKEGSTVLLTTHYLEEAQALCNKVALLQKGNLVAMDTTDNLLKKFSGIRLKIKAIKLPDNLKLKLVRQEGNYYILSINNYYEIQNILNVFKIEDISIESLDIIQADLQDVFFELTASK